MQLLLDRGADIRTGSGKWGNTLHAALEAGKYNAAQLLLDNGAGVDAEGLCQKALEAAISYGHVNFTSSKA